MLQSLNLDTATSAPKTRERGDDSSSTLDPAFSGMLALLAGTAQTIPLQAVMPTTTVAVKAADTSSSQTAKPQAMERAPAALQSATQSAGREANPSSSSAAKPAEKHVESTSDAHETASTTPEAKQAQAPAQTAAKSEAQPADAKAQAPAMTLTSQAAQAPTQASPTLGSEATPKTPSTAASPEVAASSTADLSPKTPSAPALAPSVTPASQGNEPTVQAKAIQVDTTTQPALSTPQAAQVEPKLVNDPKALVVQASAQLDQVPEGAAVTAIAGTEAASTQPKFTFTGQLSAREEVSALDGISATKHTVPTGADALAAQGTPVKVQPAVASSVSTIAKSVTAFSQVEGTIRWMVRNQEKSAELQLHPDKLGQVNISLRIEGQDVHARIWASESTTVPILQEHRAALEQSLREQGLNLSSFDLQSGSRGEDAQGGSQNRSFTPSEASTNTLSSLQDVPTLATQILGNAHQIEVFA